MVVNLNARNFSQPSVYAENATTLIPVNPNPGVPYRDPNVNPATYSNGQPFDSIVDSRIWNQLLYALSAFARENELFGFARWSPLTDYVAGANVTATNGELYRALKPSGANLADGPRNPMDYPDYWQTLRDFLAAGNQQTAGGLIPIGMIDLLPFRYNALPFGWYFCNGEIFPDTNPVGEALQALPASIRLDWNIVTTGNGTNVPLLLDANGRGYFLRAVNGLDRMPGSIEQDSGRSQVTNATGSMGSVTSWHGGLSTSGVFSGTTSGGGDWFEGGNNIFLGTNTVNFSIGSVPTNISDEYRPVNIGMTPAIYLGV